MIKSVFVCFFLLIGSYFSKDNIKLDVFQDLFAFIINLAAIIITMVGLWLAVVYNDFVKLITESTTENSIEECKSARKFIISVFYLSLVILLSICSIVSTKLFVSLYSNEVMRVIYNFSLLISTFLLILSLYKVLSPFAIMMWKLEIREKKEIERQKRHRTNKNREPK